MIPVIYGELCPQCHGDLNWKEIEREICEKKQRKLSYTKLSWEYLQFEKFFVERFGEKPRALQRMWAKRILKGESFAAIAPTGIGKTLFGVIISLYLAGKGKRSYIIMPTTVLLKDVVDKIMSLRKDEKVVYYHSRMKKREKEEAMEKIRNGDFDILLTTTAFLTRNFGVIEKKKIHLVFVDDVDSLLKRSKNLEKVVKIVENSKGVLMVSTATGTKGYNTRILRERLNFDVGNVRNAVRNVDDIKASKDEIKRIMKIMGGGALIFVPTIEEGEKLLAELNEFKIGFVTAEEKKAYEDFKNGVLDFLMGIATPYGSLVRGIDIPERIRYVIFYGIPRFKISLRDVESLSEKALRTIGYLLSKIDSQFLNLVNGEIDILRSEIKKFLEEKEKIVGDTFIYEDGFIILPDIRTYIQGSGRASRLYSGGITKGASFVLDDDLYLKIFENRASVYDIDVRDINEVDLDILKREIDEDRRRIKYRGEEKEIITPILFIVESPNKAKHISRFFGKPNIRMIGEAIVYEVTTGKNVLLIAPSLGHVVDLSTQRGYHGIYTGKFFTPVYNPIRKCRDCGYQFTSGSRCPICGSDNIYNAYNQIEVLRELAFEAEEVVIGTDPDTEGEKIAWDLFNLLKPFANRLSRAEFHEVTKKAILKAINERREINENLVKAQIVRRIEDRWIGFELSQILWKVFKDKNLSAGRAQTPVLKWIIERYLESKKREEAWFIEGTDIRVPWKENVYATVELVKEEEKVIAPPPYTTDEILRDANTLLHLSSQRTMNILQKLFENGLITYHRTSSTHVSSEGLNLAKKFLGDDFHGRRWGEEGAHECIRPTRPWSKDDLKMYILEGIVRTELDDKELEVYDLIFRRFMASQTDTFVKFESYRITAEKHAVEAKLSVKAWGRGYQLYPYGVKIHNPLPRGKVKIKVEKRIITPRPYTQAEVIRLMRERGIGRPSTYATIIDKIFWRNYVIERHGYLIPTKRGFKVNSYLFKHYSGFVSEERTRTLEKKMDDVESGVRDYQEILRELYDEMIRIRRK